MVLNQVKEVPKLLLNSPVTLIIRGIPGSGKSMLAKRIASYIPDSSQVLTLDPDAINYESAEYIDFTENLSQKNPDLDASFYPYRYLVHTAKSAIGNDKIILWNQPFGSGKKLALVLKRLTGFYQEYQKEPNILIIEVEIDHNTAWERVTARKAIGGHGPSSEKFTNMVATYEKELHVYGIEGYPIYRVNGAGNVDYEALKIISSLNVRAS